MAEGNSSLQDDELYLPRTVVNKLIKEIVPNIRVSTDARDLLLNCCTEFIHLLASEASDISEKQMKKVISPEHVVEALTTLGFQEYVQDVKAVHKEYKEQASKHRKRGKSKLDRLGIPEEELARQQQQLFDEARQQQLESEMNQQRQLQSVQQQEKQSQPQQSLPQQPTPSAPSVASAPSIPQPVATASLPAGGTPVVAARASASDNSPIPLQRPGVPNTAITAASLQATTNLLQQALAMASAQMAQGEASSQQSLIQQQSAALQAALAAQRLTPAQAQQLLLLQQAQPQAPEGSPAAANAPGQPQGADASSQELNVAQMMITLAQAAGCNTSLAQNIPKTKP